MNGLFVRKRLILRPYSLPRSTRPLTQETIQRTVAVTSVAVALVLSITTLDREVKAQTFMADTFSQEISAEPLLLADTQTEPFLDPSISDYEIDAELLFESTPSVISTDSNVEKVDNKKAKNKNSIKEKEVSVQVGKGAGLDSKSVSLSGTTFPVPGGIISQGLHAGNAIDFAAPRGSGIVAYKSGTVNTVKTSGWNGGYGSYVGIDHDDGTSAIYAHIDSASVSQGQRVSAGDAVGTVGMTGKTTGPHLHLAVVKGSNPFSK